MRVLLDTHAVIWWVDQDGLLLWNRPHLVTVDFMRSDRLGTGNEG
jgi:PIN domain nuclease of toxin-antitoxin system